jgi:hypothetical protein
MNYHGDISNSLSNNTENWDSSVGIVTGYGLDCRAVEVRVPVEARFFSSPRRPNRFWDPTIVLFLSKITVLFIFQNNVSETGFCLRLQVKYTQLGPIDRATPCL